VAGQTPVSSEIDVRLLGPLEVEVSGQPVRFDGVKQRRLFVVLALRAPRPVSVDELLDALWGDELPAGAVTALQKQISRLRQRLGDGPTVRHRATGYALDIDPQAIDAHRFEALLEGARRARGRNDPERAAADLRTALALWRGEALADHRFDEFAQVEIARASRSVGGRRSRSGWRRSWTAGPMRIWSVSCRRWSRSIRCASGCGPN
jgi:DNA-binding SARP family transcriptional activator